MFTKAKDEVPAVQWGNGTSYRLLNRDDNMTFGVAHTIVNAGTSSKLRYDNHLEACYCISGQGTVTSADGQTVLEITPGVLYALNEHDAHVLAADANEDMHLISIFSPALAGTESHRISDEGYSSYGAA